MAAPSRKSVSSFNLSFLDIMFCGFGAVVLLVLIINSNIIDIRNEKVANRRLEFLQQKQSAKQRQENLEELRQKYNTLEQEVKILIQARDQLATDVRETQDALSKMQSTPNDDEITSLQGKLRALQTEKLELESTKIKNREQGYKVRKFEGEGNRQYLTGLKLGGERVLILVDSSASMLAAKVVDIIRLKVQDEQARQKSSKWQKVVATVEWIIANLPPESSVQLFSFNTGVNYLNKSKQSGWINTTDFTKINEAIAQLKTLVPEGGTSLENAFIKSRTLTPRPDNIILITDGLPTQGKKAPIANTISGNKRIKLFEQAVNALPSGIPINTILFPIEGDPMASVLYWQLAINSGGSMFTPTRDWP